MSWGERSCDVPKPCKHNPTLATCNVFCPSYSWDGKTEPDSGPGLTRTQRRLLGLSQPASASREEP
jgi:hypothetical protein